MAKTSGVLTPIERYVVILLVKEAIVLLEIAQLLMNLVILKSGISSLR